MQLSPTILVLGCLSLIYEAIAVPMNETQTVSIFSISYDMPIYAMIIDLHSGIPRCHRTQRDALGEA